MSDTATEPPPPTGREMWLRVQHQRRASAAIALRERQATMLRRGVHPITQGPLHPEHAPTGHVLASGRRCGNCRFRTMVALGEKQWPKCHFAGDLSVEDVRMLGYPRDRASSATNVQAHWPACADHQPAGPTSASGGPA